VNGYVDLHSHVLPGIDDGPADLDAALAMLRVAAGSGTAMIAATPHLSSAFPGVRVRELAERCQQLRDASAREEIEIGLVSGAEVSLVWALEASEEELRLATYDQRGTDMLIETPAVSVVGLDMLLYQLHGKGLRTTLAHPERSPEFQRDPEQLAELVREGVLLQVDADTLLGGTHRSATNRLGRELCLRGLAHTIASDGHRASSWRPVTRLAQAAQAAAALVGPERAHWLTVTAPAAIIAGAELPEPPAVAPERERRWPWSRG
jgi:protein-tyrosine phosphatase